MQQDTGVVGRRLLSKVIELNVEGCRLRFDPTSDLLKFEGFVGAVKTQRSGSLEKPKRS